MNGWKVTRLITYGFLLGTAGVKILSSQDAKKLYTHVTAAALRGADCVMKTVTTVKENCDDIVSDARLINENRRSAACDAQIQDACDAK